MAVSTDNVSVVITVADKAIDQAGFGVPMIVGPTQAFVERARTYAASTALASMATDGFVATDPEYLAMSKVLAQNPRPSSIKVGRRAAANVPDLDCDITPATPVEGEIFTLAITGAGGAETHTAIADATPTAVEIATALFTAVNGGANAVTAVDDTGSTSITGDVAGEVFDITCSANLGFDDVTVDAAVATELAAIAAYDNDWYGLILASHSTLENVAAAAWAETNKKLFFPASNDTDILSDTAGNFLETLNTASYNYTAGMFSRSPGEFPGAAWMGNRFPLQPGTETYKFVTLAGVTVDSLTATDISNIRSNKGNYYFSSQGINMTSEGWAASGRYIDVTRFVDWLVARLGEAVFSLLVNDAATGKTPMTDSGINKVVSAVEGVLETGVRVTGLSDNPKPVVTYPSAAAISTANKAGRILPDIDFSGTLGGAIHKTTLTGKVSV